MTVAELINLLQQEDPDREVFAFDTISRKVVTGVDAFKWFGENPVKGVDIVTTREDYDLT